MTRHAVTWGCYPILQACTVAVPEKFAFAAYRGQVAILTLAESRLLVAIDHCGQAGLGNVAQQVFAVDKMIATVEVSIVLDSHGTAAHR